jgi:hypothetical protein
MLQAAGPRLGMMGQSKDRTTEVEIGDLPAGIKLLDADRMMDKCYGDHVHQNAGTHMEGDIPCDKMWQDYWQQLIDFPSQTCDAPFLGVVGHHFVEILATLLQGIKAKKGRRSNR